MAYNKKVWMYVDADVDQSPLQRYGSETNILQDVQISDVQISFYYSQYHDGQWLNVMKIKSDDIFKEYSIPKSDSLIIKTILIIPTAIF
ncbi:hypothetical protein ACTXT7_011753 [Hymenolepis weldensis]